MENYYILFSILFLDLGCGYGENDIYCREVGAKAVLEIDISDHMLKIAYDEALKKLKYDSNKTALWELNEKLNKRTKVYN